VSPIETIGLAFSMVVILYSVVHSVGAICQNPLVIYLDPTQQQEMLNKCEVTRWSNEDDEICKNAAIVGMVVMASLVVVFTIIVGWPVLRKFSWAGSLFRKGQRKHYWESVKINSDETGLLSFLICLFAQLISLIKFAKYYVSPWSVPEEISPIFLLIPFATLWAIAGCIEGTILNWTQFDSRTPSLIHFIPFLG
jgi:hypothetical protein